MALDGEKLGDKIMEAIAKAIEDAGLSPLQREAFWRAVGRGIVDHLVQEGAITVLVNGAVVGARSRIDFVGEIDVVDDPEAGVVRVIVRPPG